MKRRVGNSIVDRAGELRRAAMYLKQAKGATLKSRRSLFGAGYVLTYDDAVDAMYGRAALEEEAAAWGAQTVARAVKKAAPKAAA